MEGNQFEDAVERVLEKASKRGASYCEARTENLSNETINIEGKLLKSSYDYSATGAGVRVIAGGAWGFSSTADLSDSSLQGAVDSAIRRARAAGEKRRTPVKLCVVKTARDRITTAVKIKFQDVDFRDKVNALVECNKKLRSSDEVIKTTATLVEVQSDKYIGTSEGARISFKHSMAFGTLTAFASSSGVSQLASIEFGGSGGYEVAEPSYLLELSQDVGERARRLLKAKTCPNIGEIPIVMDPTYLALLVHEIIGHPSEADRVLGWENAWGGGSWWQGMQGQQVGSEMLNAVDEGNVEGSIGYTPYDDEAVKCERNYLIEDGRLVGHIQSRQTAEIFDADPKGGARAFSYSCLPMVRMSNTFILGGDWEEKEILEDTKNGVLVRYYVAPSIDDKRYRWSVAPQETYLIKNGEIHDFYRDAVVMGIAPEFFKSIDAVGENISILPITGCGKGDPEQLICVGNGGPTLRGVANVVGRG